MPDAGDWERIESFYEALQPASGWNAKSSFAAYIRVLSEGKIPVITDSDRAQMKKDFTAGGSRFLDAVYLNILTADSIALTNNGYELHMRAAAQEHGESIAPPPESLQL